MYMANEPLKKSPSDGYTVAEPEDTFRLATIKIEPIDVPLYKILYWVGMDDIRPDRSKFIIKDITA